MEVHTHTYTARKKWTHYFWEFFMLFLAISLGFFVENQREHRLEQKRAGDFAASLYNEVKTDTTILADNLRRTEVAYFSLDTLISLLAQPIQKSNTGNLYYYSGLGMFNNFFTANEATLLQMKSSGAIRYYRNYDLVSAITDYEYNIRFIYQMETNLYMNFMEARKIQYKIFDSRYNYSSMLFESSYSAYKDSLAILKKQSIPLIDQNQMLVAEYRNWCQNRLVLDKYKITNYNRYLQSANKLLRTLKDHYHLK